MAGEGVALVATPSLGAPQNDADMLMTLKLNNNAGKHVIKLRTHYLHFLACVRVNRWARVRGIVLAVVMLAGVLWPFVPAGIDSVVLLNREGRVEAQGSPSELAELAELQLSNGELQLVQYSMSATRQELAGLATQGGPRIQVCAEEPCTWTWGELEGGSDREEAAPRRASLGFILRIRHYG